MEKNYSTDDFLAKWASGELSESEKEAFQKTEDYKYYQAILEGTDILEVPEYDKEKLFKAVQKTKFEEPRIVPIIPKWAYGVAASMAILIGAFLFLDNSVSHEAGVGEKLAVTLPDNSEVVLNAMSELTYKKRNWGDNDRRVSLSGEAFFTVEEGSRFLVETKNGTVTVLGTQFTVTANDNIFEVACFTGKVRAKSENRSEILTKGNGVRLIANSFEQFSIGSATPSWLQNESSFVDAPLVQVIKAIEGQYGISIDYANIDIDQRFTGSFTHEGLETALRTVFESMGITFTFKNGNSIELSKK